MVARTELWQTFLHFAGTNQRIARLGQEASKPEVEGKGCAFYCRGNIRTETSCFLPKLSTHLDNPGRQGWMHYCLAFCATHSCFDLGFLGNSTVSFRGWKCATCVVGAKAAVHHFAWLDATGRLFGLCEVLLSYIDGREMVLSLASWRDDFKRPWRSLWSKWWEIFSTAHPGECIT